MPTKSDSTSQRLQLIDEWRRDDDYLAELPGWIFYGQIIYLDLGSFSKEGKDKESKKADRNDSFPELRLKLASNIIRFAGGKLTDTIHDETITHIVVGDDKSRLKDLRDALKWSVVYRCIQSPLQS
jgi:DNA ligase 4